MRTVFVYVLVFDNTTIYYEQLLASVWSLKYYNKCHVTVATDEESHQLMLTGWRKQYADLFDEIIPFHFDESVSKVERSRQLKTTLRQRVIGDLLFIDTDTVITGDLSEIDNLTCNIGMVEDMNCPFDKNPHYQDILNRNERLFGRRERTSLSYYNSGVIYAKDNENVREFYDLWNKKWVQSKNRGVVQDQPALYETCLELQDTVVPLSGIYNCQAVINVNFLSTAKVMHFFNTKDKKNAISPFIDGTIYNRIKTQQELSDEIKEDVLHCKERFISPMMIASGEDIIVWHSRAFDLLKYIIEHHRRTANAIDIIANKLLGWLSKK